MNHITSVRAGSRLPSVALGAFCLALAAACPATAAPISISTIPSWDGSNSFGDFGASGFSAWAQEIKAPAAAAKLVDFTFIVSDALQGGGTTPVPVEFTAHVAQYNPFTFTLTGPLLYSSASYTVPVTPGLAFSSFTFTPDIPVVGNASYLLFLFATNYTLQQPNDSRLRMAYVPGNVYPDGLQRIHQPFDGDLNSLFTGGWGTPGGDLAFSATFDDTAPTAVDEPGMLGLMCLGGVALAFARRKQKPCGRA